jgi:1-acyl-sn-glycerol-3-phosphate acyltransferase
MAETNKAAADTHGYQYSLGWYKAGRAFWGAFFRFYCRMEVRGTQYIPAHGPAIVCANHVSMLDPFLVGYTIRPTRWLLWVRPNCLSGGHWPT